jgi:hypothetical protein
VSWRRRHGHPGPIPDQSPARILDRTPVPSLGQILDPPKFQNEKTSYTLLSAINAISIEIVLPLIKEAAVKPARIHGKFALGMFLLFQIPFCE